MVVAWVHDRQTRYGVYVAGQHAEDRATLGSRHLRQYGVGMHDCRHARVYRGGQLVVVDGVARVLTEAEVHAAGLRVLTSLPAGSDGVGLLWPS